MWDMVCLYAQENVCSRRATQRYFELHPYGRQPNHKTFKSLCNGLGEMGSFHPKK